MAMPVKMNAKTHSSNRCRPIQAVSAVRNAYSALSTSRSSSAPSVIP